MTINVFLETLSAHLLATSFFVGTARKRCPSLRDCGTFDGTDYFFSVNSLTSLMLSSLVTDSVVARSASVFK